MRTFSRVAAVGLATAWAGLVWAARTPVGAGDPVGAATNRAAGKEQGPPVWQRTLAEAMARAGAEYRPVLAFFTSPTCGWCLRLKSVVFSDPDVQELLREYALIEIDVSRDLETAQRYQVRGVPALYILSSDGEVRQAAAGYLAATEMKNFLKQGLNPEFLKAKSADYLELLTLLDENRVPSNRWPAILVELGSEERRKDLQPRVLKLSPFPRREVVELLNDPRLAVRLGAAEIIEEITGRETGFDPWLDVGSAASNAAVIARLRAWAEDKPEEREGQRSVYSALTQEQIVGYVQDLVAEDADRAMRAMRMLEQGGHQVPEALARFLAEHPDLSAAARNRIREVRYTLILKGAGGIDASATARKLLYGNLDVRTKALSDLLRGGIGMLPILQEFLDDRDPIVRETAAEGMIRAAGWRSVPLIKDHLAREKDKDVVYSILKHLGDVQSGRAVAVLASYLSDPNEDLVVAALNSLARLKTARVQDEMARCLSDPRWRVRVAALEAVAAIKLGQLEGKVGDMIRDEDAFVRHAAVKTLTAIAAKGAVPKLEAAFLVEDGLKPAVIEAYGSMEIRVPDKFYSALRGKGPDVILGVLEAMDNSDEKDLWLAEKFLDDENLDIACAATRLLARKGLGQDRARARMIAILKKGRREQVLALLEAATASQGYSRFGSYDPFGEEAGSGEGAAAETEETEAKTNAPANPLMDSLLDAFGGGSAAPAPPTAAPVPTNAPTPTPATDSVSTAAGHPIQAVTEGDLFGAFGDAAVVSLVATNAAIGLTAVGAADTAEFLREVEACMNAAPEEEIRFQAAQLLVAMRSVKGLPILEKALDTRSASDRLRIAQGLARLPTKAILPAVKRLLRDGAEDVRTTVAELCMERTSPASLLEALLAEVTAEGAVLKPYEVPVGDVQRIGGSLAAKRVVGEWARGILKKSSDGMLQSLALILLEPCWKDEDEALVKGLTGSSSPWQRRAAYHLLGRCRQESFTNLVAAAAADPSEHVRLVVPALYTRESVRWVDYFDAERFREGRYYSSDYRSRYSLKRLPAEAKAALLKLAEDESPRVRVEAMFCLLSNREPIDLLRLVKTVESFPDQETALSRVGEFMSSNYESLGQAFAILVPFLERSRYHRYTMDRIRKHFRIDPEKSEDDDLSVILRRASTEPVTATFVEPPANRSGKAAKPMLVYFTTPGCAFCEKVEALLARLRRDVAGLEVETHNTRKLDAKRLNEALCERFGVPVNSRLVAPAVFGGGGYLIKTDITMGALRDLLDRSAGIPREDWREIPAEVLAQADESLSRRYRTAVGVGVVTLGGLVDGVNPCAFATIIFLLSYLQIARRPPREMLGVGFAFVLGVFLAYLALGMGLIEVVTRAQRVLRWFRQALNWSLAGFSLVIMVLNVRDGVLCLKGRLSEMALQLPGMLKDGIHGVIRRGTRHAHFVVAAFVVGIVISALELACTGQMYLPMIGYMIEKGENVREALGLLLLYNVAFVAPLVAVFGVACYGLTSQALIRVLQRHAALVKFCTAAFFLVLVLFFLFGDRLGAWMPK